MKLTKSALDRMAPPASGQVFVRDDHLKGFGVRLTSGGAKSFIVEKRIHGRVRRQTVGRYGELTVEQARKEAQKLLGRIASGVDPIAERREAQAQSVTLAEVFEAYLSTRKNLKASTIHDYRRVMREAFSDWQSRPLQSLTKDAIARRHDKLGERSPARANNAMRVLRALFNFAGATYEDRDGRSLFPENPVKRLTHTRAWYAVERRRTLIKRAELPAWFAAVQSLRTESTDPLGRTVGDLLLVLLFTGLRRGEAMRIRWEDVDLRERTLTIPDTKNAEPLVLPLPDFLCGLFKARRPLAAGELVFPGENGYDRIVEPRKQMVKVSERSGVDFRLHDLRRTFVTIAEGLDIPVYAIKRLVNHKMRHDVTAGYVVMDIERLRAPMEKIADYILATVGEQPGAAVLPLGRRHK